MMWYYNTGWEGFWWMIVSMVIWFAFLGLLIWGVIRALNRRPGTAGRPRFFGSTAEPTALEILGQRYARGEIDTAAFEQMRSTLVGTGSFEEPALPTRR